MSKAMEQIRQYAEMLDHRSLRERLYILLALVVLLIVGWHQLFLEPALAKRKKAISEIGRVTNEIVQFHADEIIIISQSKVDPDHELRLQVAQLDLALNNLDQQLEAQLGNLQSPQQMPVLLQQLLNKQKSLKLIKLENLHPEPLLTAAGEANAAPLGIYIHALNMELAGSYLDLLKYLAALEQMEEQVFWDILTIDTQEFPAAKIRLQIHTLSLTEDWIGV